MPEAGYIAPSNPKGQAVFLLSPFRQKPFYHYIEHEWGRLMRQLPKLACRAGPALCLGIGTKLYADNYVAQARLAEYR